MPCEEHCASSSRWGIIFSAGVRQFHLHPRHGDCDAGDAQAHETMMERRSQCFFDTHPHGAIMPLTHYERHGCDPAHRPASILTHPVGVSTIIVPILHDALLLVYASLVVLVVGGLMGVPGTGKLGGLSPAS